MIPPEGMSRDALKDELVNRIRKHPVRDWEPALLASVIALIDVYSVSGGSPHRAPVLTLVRS
jgi:hypothetical protein